MKPITEFINKIIHGDALVVLKEIPDNSVDCVFTDPPYFIGKELIIKRRRNPTKYKYKGPDIIFNPDWDKFSSEEEYLEITRTWFKECIRVLRTGGHILSFIDKFKLSYFVNLSKEMNVIPRQPLLWVKTNPVPCARKVNFMNSYEMIFWGTKETTSRKFAVFNYELGQHRDIFEAPTCRGNERVKDENGRSLHIAQKPIKIIKEILLYLTRENEIVLDPFTGTGTIPCACLELNRRFIAIEINEKYVKMANERIQKIKQINRLF